MQQARSSKKKSNKSTSKKSSLGAKQRSFPTAISREVVIRQPNIRSTNGTTIVSHTEFVKDIAGYVAFFATKMGINPGSSSLFPWLSSIAHRFESYRFKRLRFNYEPSTSTLTSGVVQLAVDYDAIDPIPLSKDELMQNSHAVRSTPYNVCQYNLDSKDSNVLGNRRYVRTSQTYPANADPKTYDVGAFIHAQSGASAAPQAWGELYVTYEVELFTPQYDKSVDALAASAHVLATVGVDKNNTFGTAAIVSGGLPILLEANSIHFLRPCEVLLNVITGGTGMIASSITIDSGGSVTNEYELINAAATYRAITHTLRVNAADTRVTFNETGNTTVTSTEVRLGAYNFALS